MLVSLLSYILGKRNYFTKRQRRMAGAHTFRPGPSYGAANPHQFPIPFKDT